MRILITGATGFLGSHVLDALLGAGHHIAALLRPGTDSWRIADRLSRISVIAGSLDDPAASAADIKAFAPEAVVNIAWNGVGNDVHNDPAQPRNLDGLRAFLDVAAESGTRHWIGLGSQAEYGPKDHPISEDEPPAPATAYGRAKLDACRMCETFCTERQIRFAWLRLFSCYGPKDKATWLIPSIILKLLAGEAPALTDGLQRMDYLYATDAAAAVLAVVDTAEASGVFNLGSGEAAPVRDIVAQIAALIDPQAELGFGAIPRPENAQMLMQADITRLKMVIGWAPSTPLHDGLAATVDWFRSQQS